MNESRAEVMYTLLQRLFPICRSITGDGVRSTLEILKGEIPLTSHEVPSGTKAFDWTVPQEWNIRDAYIENEAGERVVDFKKNNLHVVGYSIPVDSTMSLAELQEHLHSLPEQPDAIPYVTSYYKEQWGFCFAHRDRVALKEGMYRVRIDSELKQGNLTYGELLLRGKSEKEILLSTYMCHPSMGNDNLSGPVVTTQLAKWLAEQSRRYTYRIIFIPETIGALTYLSQHLDEMQKNMIAGFNVTCVGDDRAYSFMPSRRGDTLADRAALRALNTLHPDFKRYSFLDRGSDERQYCAAGIDLPVVSIMRSKYGEYPEYHTSLDNLSFVTPSGLQGAYETLQKAIESIEAGEYYRTTVLGEPQMGKRGLYPSTGTKETRTQVRSMMNIIAYADGTRDVEDVAAAAGISAEEAHPIIEQLAKEGVLRAGE